MLHILLLILKIIGIIIVAILGILVLLIGVVLFVPVRYETKINCDDTIDGIDARAKVTWLMHLVKVTIYYQNRELSWRIRIAWKHMQSGQEDEQTMNKEVGAYDEELEKLLEETKEQEELMESSKENPEKRQNESLEEDSESNKSIPEKIKCTINNICDKIKALLEKKDKIMEFLADEVHQRAFSKVKKEVIRLFHKLKPRKLKADIQYGFDDPYDTGKLLAGFSVLYPLTGDNVSIIPDFEQKVLKGDFEIAGRIRLSYFVSFLWRLMWCKEVRMTYRDVRKFEI